RMSGGHPAAGEPFYFATTRCGAHTMMDVVCHFFDPDKAPLLRRHFIPLARALSAEGYAVHLDRHWLHGPHVLLRFAPGPGVEIGCPAGIRPQGSHSISQRLAVERTQ